MPKNALQIIPDDVPPSDNPLMQGARAPVMHEQMIQPLRLSMPGGDATTPLISLLPDGTILAGGNQVGRVKYDHGDRATRIADIQIDPSAQNQGFGSDAIRQIQAEAAARGNPVVLSTDAFRGKQAQADQLRLYQRLGFVPNVGPDAYSERIGNKRVAEQLIWRPAEPER